MKRALIAAAIAGGLGVPCAARAQALEITTGVGFGVFRVDGALAETYHVRGGGLVDLFISARRHGWELGGGYGAHWGATEVHSNRDFTLVGWHADLARHLPLATATRRRGRGLTTLELGLHASAGLVGYRFEKVTAGELDHARGWRYGSGLTVRLAVHDHPGDIGFVLRVALDLSRTSLAVDDGHLTAVTLTVTLLGGGR